MNFIAIGKQTVKAGRPEKLPEDFMVLTYILSIICEDTILSGSGAIQGLDQNPIQSSVGQWSSREARGCKNGSESLFARCKE